MSSQSFLLCYDVNTSSEGGKRRLRKVAKACEAYGQRVQYSVFEISATEVNLHKLMTRVLKIIDPDLDSIRLYRLPGERDRLVTVYGRDRWIDFDGPLVV